MGRTYGSITIVDTTDIERIYMVYKGSESNTTAPTLDWSTIDTWKENITQVSGTYIWQVTVIKQSGVPITSSNWQDFYGDPTCITGPQGIQGIQGKTGIGVSSITTTYCNYGSGTPAASYSGWQSTVPTYDSTKPNYWVKTVLNYDDGTSDDPIIYKDNGITSATSTAAAANITANNANTTANNANTTANNANTTANNANTTANNALNLANGTSQHFWSLAEDTATTGGTLAAGQYITDILQSNFKQNPGSSGNLLLRSDGVYLNLGLQTLASFKSNALTFYNSAGAELGKFGSTGLEMSGTLNIKGGGRIGQDSDNYWRFGDYISYKDNSMAYLLGYGEASIQLGETGHWRLDKNRIHTGWYQLNDGTQGQLHFDTGADDGSTYYWDYGMHYPDKANNGNNKFLYIRRSTNTTSTTLATMKGRIDDDSWWTYKFYIDGDGNLHAGDVYSNGVLISGTSAPYLLKSGGTITGNLEVNGTLTKGSKNVAYLTATPTSGQILIADGTSGGIKTSGYTIAKSVPSNAIFTDENVNTSQANTTQIYLTGTSTAGSSTGKLKFDSNVYLTTTAGTLHATNFEGNLSGTASRATADGDGNTIKTTYLKLSGGNVTGAVTFGSSVSVDELTAGDLVVNGAASFTNNAQFNTINGVAVGSSPKFTDNNTTYTFTNGTNGFTVTPSGGTAQTVTVTPSISNNVTGSGTSGYLVKFTGGNTIGNGPALGTDTTKFLNNKGEWAVPTGTYTYTLPLAANGTRGGVQIGYSANGKNYPVQLSSEKMYVNVPWENTTYSAGIGLSLSGTTFSNSGVIGIKGNAESSYRTGQVNLTPNNLGAVDKNDELLTTNPFRPASLSGPYISKIDNGFYAADKRWNISMTNISGSVSNLFDGSYETAVTVTAGTTSILTMDFTPSTYFPGYPYGYILVSFYHTGIPTSVSGRVYCNYESHGIGWHNINFSPISDSGTSSMVYRSEHQGYYNISKLEISVVGASNPTTKVTQVEIHLDRPDSSKTPFLSKYGAETLYYDLTAPNFKGNLIGNVNGTASNITGIVAIANGGTGKTTANDAINALLSGLPVWSADPLDTTYFIRQDTGGSAAYGKVPATTLWNYISGKLPSWSKASSKPSYSYSEIGSAPDAIINATVNEQGVIVLTKNSGGTIPLSTEIAVVESQGANKLVTAGTTTGISVGSAAEPVYFSAGVPAKANTIPKLNNTTTGGVFYAPTAGGTADTQALVGNGATTAPKWVNISPSISITAGTGSATPKINVTVLGRSGTAQFLTTASTSVYGATKLSSTSSSTEQGLAATPKLVYDSIAALDGNLNNTTPGAGKTLTAFSQTDGKISATFSDISITKSQISDFPTSMTPAAHTHDDRYYTETEINNKFTALTNSTTEINKVKFYSGTFNAGKTYIGWIKIASFTMTTNNYIGENGYEFELYRGYNSPASESYNIRVNTGWGNASIVQLNGKAGTQIIEKFRLVRDNTNHICYFEIYVNPSYATYQNNANLRVQTYNGTDLTLLNTVQTETDSSFEIISTIDLKPQGVVSNSNFYGNLIGNADTATTASSVNWSGVASTPTTLSGYGITNAVEYLGNLNSAIGSGTPAAATKTYYENNIPSTACVKAAYNNSGTEYSLLFSRSSNWGSVLKWGYTDKYIRILRRSSSTWQSEDWEKISAGYADIADNAKLLGYQDIITTLEDLNNFKNSGTGIETTKINAIEGHSGTLGKNDGIVISIPWNAGYCHQIYVDDNTYAIHHRYYTTDSGTGVWSDWVRIIDSSNYTSYTVTKTGEGASGTWGISISGTAAKATADASGNTITSTYVKKAGDTMTGCLVVQTTSSYASYNEGIRINKGSQGYSTLLLGGTPDATSGTNAGAWWIGVNNTNYPRRLMIAHNGSGATGTYFYTNADSTVTPNLRLGSSGTITSGNMDAVNGGTVYTAISNLSGTYVKTTGNEGILGTKVFGSGTSYGTVTNNTTFTQKANINYDSTLDAIVFSFA